MFEEHTQRIAVRPVGKPGRAWVELKGSILIYRRESWATSASVFMPLEWVSVSESLRYDWKRLWRGTIALLCAVLFALPLSLLVFHMSPHEPMDLWIGLGLAVFLAIAAAISFWQFWLLPRREGVTVLRVERQPFGLDMAFWRRPGEQPVLDALVDAIRSGRRHVDTELAHPIRMNHLWHRPKPYRIAFVKGVAVSICLSMAFLFLETVRALGYGPDFPRWLYATIFAPPPFYLLLEGLRRGPLSRRPYAYRAALRAYLKGDLMTARAHLEMLLREQPGYAEARLLMVQACAEDYAFDNAFAHCAKLAEEHPMLASRLETAIWGLKRMHERMQP